MANYVIRNQTRRTLADPRREAPQVGAAAADAQGLGSGRGARRCGDRGPGRPRSRFGGGAGPLLAAVRREMADRYLRGPRRGGTGSDLVLGTRISVWLDAAGVFLGRPACSPWCTATSSAGPGSSDAPPRQPPPSGELLEPGAGSGVRWFPGSADGASDPGRGAPRPHWRSTTGLSSPTSSGSPRGGTRLSSRPGRSTRGGPVAAARAARRRLDRAGAHVLPVRSGEAQHAGRPVAARDVPAGSQPPHGRPTSTRSTAGGSRSSMGRASAPAWAHRASGCGTVRP